MVGLGTELDVLPSPIGSPKLKDDPVIEDMEQLSKIVVTDLDGRSGSGEEDGFPYPSFGGEKRRASSPPREDGAPSGSSIVSSPSLSQPWKGLAPTHNKISEFVSRPGDDDVDKKGSRHPMVSSRSLTVKDSSVFVCECCPKNPKKFNTAEELAFHKLEKKWACAYCGNRFKSKNGAERHQNYRHLCRHSWSCAALSGFGAAFYPSLTRPDEADFCGYCGDDFPRSGTYEKLGKRTPAPTSQEWEERVVHLQEVHKFRECNPAKKYFRADHFRQHLKHSHAVTSGKWTNMLENACMTIGTPPERKEPIDRSLLLSPLRHLERALGDEGRLPQVAGNSQDDTHRLHETGTINKTLISSTFDASDSEIKAFDAPASHDIPREAGNAAKVMDEEWEPLLKDAVEAGGTPFSSSNLTPNANIPGTRPANESLAMHPRLLNAARLGQWEQIPDSLHNGVRQNIEASNFRAENTNSIPSTNTHGIIEGLKFTLNVVSPSIEVHEPLTFLHLPTTTSVKELKAKLRNIVPSRPREENQRLIHRGRLVRETETMLDIFGHEQLARNLESQTLHLVIKPVADQNEAGDSYNKEYAYFNMDSLRGGKTFGERQSNPESRAVDFDALNATDWDALEAIDFGNVDSVPAAHLDNTDAKTAFSKDSGYVSMASKAHRNNPHNEGAADNWESESIASVQSIETMNTMSSVNPAASGGAAEELAETLIKDESICGLIVEGYENFDSDRFERNFRRILKKFAFSLRKEAHNNLEKSAVRLVYNYRAYVIRLIRKRLALAEDKIASTLDELQNQKASRLALERFLEQLPGADEFVSEGQAEEIESGSDNDSGLSNDEQPYLPNLEKVKLYLFSSSAYLELKQQLADFVRPYNNSMKDPLKSNLPLDPELNTVCEDLKTENSRPEVEAQFQQFGSPAMKNVQFTFDAQHIMSHQSVPHQSPSVSDSKSLVAPSSQQVSEIKLFADPHDKANFLSKPIVFNHRIPVAQFAHQEIMPEKQEPRYGFVENALLSLQPWISLLSGPTHFSTALQNMWKQLYRKPVAKGHTRIEGTCPCGHDLYAEFQTSSRDKLDKYAAILKASPSGNANGSTSQPSANLLTPPAAAHIQPHSSSNGGTRSRNLTKNNPAPSSTVQAMPMFSNNALNPSFLELCVNTGEHLKTLGEIDLASITTDGALFQAVKKRYLRLRGFRSKFWLLKPTAVSFVRFSLENRHRVGILQKPLALPPKSEVDAKKWIYDPCPLEGDPPIAEDLFLHYLQCSEQSDILFWMLRFPRKLETSLLTTAGASATFGWGIHIDEGPDFAALFKANFLVLLLSGVTALLWKFFEHDFQGAFGFACWIIAVLNSLLMAYMFKGRQE